jgi:hypothetical protein
MIPSCMCPERLICLVGLRKHGLKVRPCFVCVGKGGPSLAHIMHGAHTENMVKRHDEQLIHGIRCIPSISLVEPILNLGEHVDDWGRRVRLLLHHLAIAMTLEGCDVAVFFKHELDHSTGGDPGVPTYIVLQWLRKGWIGDRLGDLLIDCLVNIFEVVYSSTPHWCDAFMSYHF